MNHPPPNLSLVRAASKTGTSTLTVGQNTPAQFPFSETAAELAWNDVTDLDFKTPNLPVTGGSYSVSDTATANTAVSIQDTAKTVLYIAGAVVGFLLLVKVLKKLAII